MNSISQLNARYDPAKSRLRAVSNEIPVNRIFGRFHELKWSREKLARISGLSEKRLVELELEGSILAVPEMILLCSALNLNPVAIVEEIMAVPAWGDGVVAVLPVGRGS